MTTMCPSAESSTRLKSTALKNSSSVRRGLSVEDPAAEAGVAAAIRSIDEAANAIREELQSRKTDRYRSANVWKVMVVGKADCWSADYK